MTKWRNEENGRGTVIVYVYELVMLVYAVSSCVCAVWNLAVPKEEYEVGLERDSDHSSQLCHTDTLKVPQLRDESVIFVLMTCL